MAWQAAKWLKASPPCLQQALWPAQWLPTCQHNSVSRGCKMNAARGTSSPQQQPGQDTFKLRVTPEDVPTKGKLRLDAFLAAQLSASHAASRAKVQAAIKAKQVMVNGRVAGKASQALTTGDNISCTLLPGPSLEALPEDIPLDILYEDEHLMVINKPAGMPVHISAGHHTGTLVNALLTHCGLPGIRIDPSYPSNLPAADAYSNTARRTPSLDGALSLQALQEVASGSTSAVQLQDGLMGEWVVEDSEAELDEGEGEGSLGEGDGTARQQGAAPHQVVLIPGAQLHPTSNESVGLTASTSPGVLRPGIVHRLDLGTTGLLVVAKQEQALRALSAQFKARTVGRVYQSITVGCPASLSGRILTNIDRDPADRKRMAAFAYGSSRGRTAASNYEVLELLSPTSSSSSSSSSSTGAVAALVKWKLETGRTHQIRVHAKHMGHPLVGDITYGGAGMSAASAMTRGRASQAPAVQAAVLAFTRPALHAASLAFDHPVTGTRLSFECKMPADMQQLLDQLRDL